ncbi:MAG: hypothetical protein ACJ731_07435 [Vicinamibacterales bacterium]
MLVLPLLVTATMMAGTPQQAHPPSTAAVPAETPSASADGSADLDDPSGDLPVSIDRIRRKLSRPPAIKLNTQGTVFRVEVLGRKLTIEDILGPDYLKGPVPAPAGGMTHQEFLDLVTPKDVQGYAAFNNKEAATVAATSFALQWALQKAIHKFEEAKAEREREAARKEVQDALAELEKARIKAGLPPK